MSGITSTMSVLRTLAGAAAVGALLGGFAAPVLAAESGGAPHLKWSFAGIGGYFDKAQLQRGYKVYKDVCADCHSLRLVKFRNLSEEGGPGFTEAQVKTLAAEVEVEDGVDELGNPAKRPGRPSDAFKSPFANETAARGANGGALPPDLSLITKAREAGGETPWFMAPVKMLQDIMTGYQEGGADYLHALLNGYHEKPPAYKRENGHLTHVAETAIASEAGLERCASVTTGEDGKPDVCNTLQEGLHYNAAFPGGQIAMPQPLTDDRVTYTDGSPQTADQYARDLGAFLTWAADPHFETRKHVGIQALLYLALLSFLLYFAKRQVWSRIAH